LSARRTLSLWAPVLLYLGILFFISGRSRPPTIEFVWDKLLHAVAYMVLSVFTIRAFHGSLGPLRWRPTLYAFFFTVGYGVTDEFHQSFVPGRNASSHDVAADVVGFLLAVALLYFTYQGSFRASALRGRGET
jgi:VanZ family protein